MHTLLVLAFIGIGVICDRHGSTNRPEPPRADLFATTIKPSLQKTCSPCHFEGGVMYTRLPFDKPETITHLGTKLFTRVKDEQTRKAIREFIALQKPAPPTS